MKTKIFLLLFLLTLFNMSAQEACRFEEQREAMYKKHPKSLKESEEFEILSKKLTKEYLQKTANKSANSSAKVADYIIPVVFHVYGTNQNGKTMTYDKIVATVDMLNRDYNGLNADYNSVNPLFTSLRGTMNIEFRLAKIDPNGNCTTGVVFHPVKKGFGNGGGYDDQIQADAWDNYKYMNIYLQADFYNTGATNDAGVAWGPDTTMSNNNTARVVYNGAFIFGNNGGTEEFAGVLSHEVGHFFNLLHPSDGGGCAGTDYVDDTPQSQGGIELTCTAASYCGHPVITEDYMDYTNCMKMFTQGQVARMVASMQHPARFPLWQPANLIATGVAGGVSTLTANTSVFKEQNANNGSFATNSVITLNGTTFALSSGTMVAGTHFTHTFPAGITPVLTVNSDSQVTLTLTGNAANHNLSDSSHGSITFLPAAFAGGTAGLNCTSLDFSLLCRNPYGIFYVDVNPDRTVVAGGSTYNQFGLESKAVADDGIYGIYVYGSSLRFDTRQKGLVSNGTTKEITYLGYNEAVNGTRNWVNGGNTGAVMHLLRDATYTTWTGQTGYIGFRYTSDGDFCYGWFKVIVNAAGNGYTLTEYAYNTEPNATIYTGMVANVIKTVSPTTLREAISNNGSFTTTSTIRLTTNNGSFTQSSGTLTEGTHYTVSGVPAGLTPVLTVMNSAEVRLSFTGNATSHTAAANSTVVVTFRDAAITGGVAVLDSPSFNVALKFKNPFGIFHVDIADLTVTPASVWEEFSLEDNANADKPIANQSDYGMYVYQNSLRFETYQQGLICNGATKEITYLGNDEPVNGTRNIVNGGNSAGTLHVLRSATYTTWTGQTGYIGFRYLSEGQPCYGWFKVIVSADGIGYTLTEYAYNNEPNGTIYTPPALGVDEIDGRQDMTVYPNPFKSEVTINTSKLLGENIKVAIVNVLGQHVYEKVLNVNSQNTTIDTHSLSKGLYVIQLTINGKKSIVKKIIKN